MKFIRKLLGIEKKGLDMLIDKYPEIFENLRKPFYRISSDIPEPWIPVVDDMCKSIETVKDIWRNKGLDPVHIKCDQIKEKWGYLEFYYTSYAKGREFTDPYEGIIATTREVLWRTCETCGSTKDIRTTKGWVSRVCKKCYDEK